MIDFQEKYLNAPHVLNLGLGVQSTTLYLMACHDEIQPRPEFAIFADPGSERQKSYEMLEFLQEYGKAYHFPIVVISAGNLFENMVEKSRRGLYTQSPPLHIKKTGRKGRLSRQCTADYKIRPINRYLRKHLRPTSKNPVVSWIGISVDESARMRPSRNKHTLHRYPLIEKRLSRADCYHWLTSNNYPIPVSSACLGCPYLKDTDFQSYSDEEIEYVADWEKRLHESDTGEKDNLTSRLYVHKSLRPFGERPFMDSKNENQLTLELDTEDKDSLCDEGGCFL